MVWKLKRGCGLTICSGYLPYSSVVWWPSQLAMNCGPMAGRSGSTTSISRFWSVLLTNSILPDGVCRPSKPTVSPGRGPQSGVSRLRPSANQRMAGVLL